MGDIRLEWSTWVASIGPSLIAVTIWTLILAAAAMNLKASRRAYQHGLAAAVMAYVVMVIATTTLAGMWNAAPIWIAVVLFAPVIEESSRLFMANEVRNDPPASLTFGFGYGLFEAGLKFFDALAFLVREPMHPAPAAISLLAPIVPLLMHVFLSVLVLALLRRGVALPLIWIIAVGLHGLHNWSVQVFVVEGWLHLAGGSLLRVALFVALIAMLLPLTQRSPGERGQMTSAP